MRKIWMLIAGIVLSCALAGTALAEADGAAVYRRCSGCHQSTGGGISGVFPPLAGHAPKLVSASRTYPVRVVLFGLTGEIEVGGKKYKGKMLAYEDKLKDDEIAAVLNHILASWGNDKMLPKGHKKYTAAEVKAQRGKKLTSREVYEARQKLKIE
jgi:mono/diheme cytochrome c family protein